MSDAVAAAKVKPGQTDISGQRFGRLIAIMPTQQRAYGSTLWRCLCDCGKETVVGQTLLQTGKTKSCGCLQNRIVLENMKFVAGTSVTALEHTQNRLIASNTSGYNGVYYNQKAKKWTAQIGFKGKTTTWVRMLQSKMPLRLGSRQKNRYMGRSWSGTIRMVRARNKRADHHIHSGYQYSQYAERDGKYSPFLRILERNK